MQQVLLRRAHHSTGAPRGWCDTFAEDKDFAGHRARRHRPRVDAVDAVDPEDQAIILGLVSAYETAHYLGHLGQNVSDTVDHPLVAGAAQQDGSLADPDRAFELDRGTGGRDPLRTR